jgi:uncharacterized protein (DUF433 family)
MGAGKDKPVVDLSNFIVRDPKICGGEPVFRGTRVLLRTVLASLADGEDESDILTSFPTLRQEPVLAAIAFAAAPGGNELPRRG